MGGGGWGVHGDIWPVARSHAPMWVTNLGWQSKLATALHGQASQPNEVNDVGSGSGGMNSVIIYCRWDLCTPPCPIHHSISCLSII